METLNRNLLLSLLDLAQRDVAANVVKLSFELGVPRAAVACGLNELAEQGLVRPSTVRLTMMGLVLASSVRAEMRRSRERLAEERAQERHDAQGAAA